MGFSIPALTRQKTPACDLEPHENPGKAPVIGGSVNVNQELVVPLDLAKPMISITLDLRYTQIAQMRAGPITVSEDIQLTRNDQPKK